MQNAMLRTHIAAATRIMKKRSEAQADHAAIVGASGVDDQCEEDEEEDEEDECEDDDDDDQDNADHDEEDDESN